MNKDFNKLRDPDSGRALKFIIENLISEHGISYPIIRGIPRFVDADNYSDDFGKQWNMFPKTQLDSFTGLDISESRLARCFRGYLSSLKGVLVLEAGSGAGRFTEILLKNGAEVHTFDYSSAVEANAENNGDSDLLTLAQADIRKIPFVKASYDYVVCLGVLQHTPDPEASIRSLWEMLKPGGALVIDHYQWKWRIVLPPPIGQALGLYRKIILRLPRKSRVGVVKMLTDFWFPWHWKFRDSWFMSRILRRLSPVIFHYPYISLNGREQYYNWALLDTHDSTTDFYKHYRTPKKIRVFLENLGAKGIIVSEGGNGVEAFCRK
jgi:2-polyprenyl-3-methyl-5-hydroxy-6-metoxy-1,4-benzoquinol methylase